MKMSFLTEYVVFVNRLSSADEWGAFINVTRET